jgi:hypothetical protein
VRGEQPPGKMVLSYRLLPCLSSNKHPPTQKLCCLTRQAQAFEADEVAAGLKHHLLIQLNFPGRPLAVAQQPAGRRAVGEGRQGEHLVEVTGWLRLLACKRYSSRAMHCPPAHTHAATLPLSAALPSRTAPARTEDLGPRKCPAVRKHHNDRSAHLGGQPTAPAPRSAGW